MARIRTIKPEFWTDEDMAEVSECACLLAIGLLNYADDDGYFNANPKLIKAAVFPIREPSVPITVMIRELSNHGYLSMFYTTDGRHFGLINNFAKHQVVNKKKDSKIKEMGLVPYDYGIDTGLVPVGMDQGSGKGKEPPLLAREKNFQSDEEQQTRSPPAPLPQIGKFVMHADWQPSQEFQRQVALWGIKIPDDGYKDTDRNEFIDYWAAEGKVFTQTQWEQKFARHLERKRSAPNGKRKGDEEPVPHWNSPEGWKDFM